MVKIYNMNNKLFVKHLILETLSEAEVDSEVDKGMSDAYTALKSNLSILEGYKAKQPKKEGQINEALGAMVASGLLAAPKIIEWIAKSINYLVKTFSKKDESQIAKSIEKFAHKWEKLYITIIKKAVKYTGFLENLWKKEKQVDEEKLELVAKVIFALILALAAGTALKTILSPASPVIKAIEATLGGIKATEIIGIAKTVANKIGIKVV